MAVSNFATPDLSDDCPVAQVLPFQWQRFGRRVIFGGPASTVACFEDNSRVAEAVAEAGEGRVLLVDGQGSLDRSLLGDRLARKAGDNGWAGVIVIGAVRDVEVIDDIDIGVYSLGVCPRKTEKRDRGDRDISLEWRGITVSPGHWIYADRNGVLVSAGPIHG
ncbi:S-adenosylmethionine:2-demethylmenaquinonemethyl transferase [Luminiphilus syltensis NOR5-1B]|uniref:4-hydroxy-4-methyl-2-oxoglutarate aldolase n=1 Tax=Luminiphilus syltensis NOR5-1B TaxID=565045 RepID=B8KQP2_9GAMM|nr:ribonuclease E activity regulator RraA [Luminiphilus syltensis]EED36634.1 S-adenosylmethionine:2-demethylmenaquinonemethyl transferase [Luminiphilus syltensis NOR5-1B]